MASGPFVPYFRVSTARQGRSGLGLDAQREAVPAYLNGGNWTILADFVEIESGRKSDRPKLTQALDLCRLTGATLLIAKLDRLARDAHFLLGLQKAGVESVACDMPTASGLTIGIMALVAEEEARASPRVQKPRLLPRSHAGQGSADGVAARRWTASSALRRYGGAPKPSPLAWRRCSVRCKGRACPFVRWRRGWLSRASGHLAAGPGLRRPCGTCWPGCETGGRSGATSCKIYGAGGRRSARW
jgi:hypothetical protein